MRRVSKVVYDGMSIQNQRASNMDSLLVKERVIEAKSVYLAVVCDGVGSMEDGAFASSTAIEMLSEWFDSLCDIKRIGLKLIERVKEINARISFYAQAKQLHTASTLSALLLTDSHYYIVHAGDSRIYGFKGSSLMQLTRDQVSNGKLTAWLGNINKTDFQYDESINDYQTFLLCSDGLYKKVAPDFLQEAIATVNRNNLSQTIDGMIKHAVECGETDNISLLILFVGG